MTIDTAVRAATAQERQRIIDLLESYEATIQHQIEAMRKEGVGDPFGPNAQLDMLRLLLVAIDKPV